ncbi:hypothetical protein ABZ721_06105 [Streptomyces sp. NPDC006733]|uniref:hypothetical protein n=1 Tax=Streptomyces sp. NPDC006733 TaxID=3155460 RepID=UPI0033CDDC4B
MAPDDENHAEQWPLPPSWMWSCQECTELYKQMKGAIEASVAARSAAGPGVDYDPMDIVLTKQLRLARHIALTHAPDVPDVDPECARCVSDAATRPDADEFVLEHRARHLFMPPIVAGLM